MSYISTLDNQGKIVIATGQSTASISGSTSVWITINEWPSFAQLDRISVYTANNTYTAGTVTLKVLNDGAAYRSALSGDANYNAEFSGALTVAEQSDVIFNNDAGVYIEDTNRTGNLYINLKSTAAFATSTIFTIKAYGKRLASEKINDAEHTPFKYDNSFKVLVINSTGTKDYSTNANRNISDPWGIASTNQSQYFTALTTDTDHLLIGTAKIPKGFYFLLRSDGVLPSGVTVLAEYWNGSAWTTATVSDNTSDGQTTASGFSYSGCIRIVTATGWQTSQIATDPLKVYMDALSSGTTDRRNTYIPAFTYNPDRYWLRFTTTGIGSNTVKIVGIQQLN